MINTCSDCHVHCAHCNERTIILRNGYCSSCWSLAAGGVRLRGAQKCVVQGCENATDMGDFVGNLCLPCHSFLARGEGIRSQAYRNEGERYTKMQIREAVAHLNSIVNSQEPTLSDQELAKLVKG